MVHTMQPKKCVALACREASPPCLYTSFTAPRVLPASERCFRTRGSDAGDEDVPDGRGGA